MGRRGDRSYCRSRRGFVVAHEDEYEHVDVLAVACERKSYPPIVDSSRPTIPTTSSR
jgi:hypothetical protein